MKDQTFLLKSTVAIEPLVNRWYASAYLVSPASAAMTIAFAHLPVLDSFLQNPQIHVSALKNVSMRGGPFIDYPEAMAPIVRALRDRTVREQSHMLDLAKAIRELEGLLAEARGGSLEPYYAKVPEALKGYIELCYSLDNRAGIRFIEPLLYRSSYRNLGAQSVFLSSAHGDQRPFALATPKVDSLDGLFLPIAFGRNPLDEIYRLRWNARPKGEIRELLSLTGDQDAALDALLTTDVPVRAERFAGDGVRIRYFGHACVLVETKDTSVLFDPVIAPVTGAQDRYTHADLPEVIDYVVLTHGHQDHCMLEPLLELRSRARHIVIPRSAGGSLVDPSLRLVLRHLEFPSIIELDELETLDLPGGDLLALPFLGEHSDLDVRTKLGYALRLGGRTALFLADSNNLEPVLYRHLAEAVGPVDILFIGMECEGAPMSWLYGPFLPQPLPRKFDNARRLDGSDCKKAVDIVDRFRPEEVVIYAMGQEPWLGHVMSIAYTPTSRPIVESNELIELCHQRGLRASRPYCRAQWSFEPK